MEQNKIENPVKNSFFALVLRIVQIIFPFIIRTIVIRSLGLAYVGVSGLFASVFGIMSLAELGVGNAMLQALYEPISKNETDKIRAILNFYKRAYYVIGAVIIGLGFAFMPFAKSIIKEGTYPCELNIYYIYLICLSGTVIGYFVYSYKALLLEANQRGRDANKVRIIFTIATYGIQMLVLVTTYNYYLYLIVTPFMTLLTSLGIARVCDRQFEDLQPKGIIEESDKERLKSNISALFLHKVGSVVNNNVDGIVISIVFGATVLGAYNNYYYVVGSISAMVTVCYTAILPSFGHGIIGKSKEQNYTALMSIQPLDNWINGWCSICLACLLPQFIILWAGEESSFGYLFSILFAIYFYFWRVPDPITMYKDALGIWQEDKWRPLMTAIANLILNIILVNLCGIYGILISTIIAVVFISFPISVKVLMRNLNVSSRKYMVRALLYFMFDIAIGVITWILCYSISLRNAYFEFLIRAFICVIVPNMFYIYANRNNRVLIKLFGEIRQKWRA